MIHCKLHATIGTCLYVTCANFYCCCNTLRKIRSYGRCKGTRHINPFTPRYLLVTCRCQAWVAGCFKCLTLHIGQVDSWTRWQSPPWPQILVTCSNVAPHIDWRSSFSIPICFFLYIVSTHVLLCHTDSYPVWRNSVGQHLLYLSKFCTSRWGHLAASFSPVKSA